ncbi:MAG: type I polyketide synthase, partial [Blastocatellia bacterium]
RLEGLQLFDAGFFGISPREAEIIDPQHRLFLECAWEALEDSGYDTERYKGSVGVYAGSGFNNYLFYLLSNRELVRAVGLSQIIAENHAAYLPNRVSYKLNLKGPSYAVQTTCSTSLVAVHLACQGLLNRECDMALAGGVNVSAVSEGYQYQEGGVLSPDGHCRAFDAEARGTVGGDGVGIIVLKRLADALSDGDTVHGVIKGSAINNDGADKIGFTAPSVEGQADVIRKAQLLARVEPETIAYVEAHGTGTVLGDPIEIAALTQAFRAGTDRNGFCAIGSVKTNIGHLDAAAGIAGLIKTVLAIKKAELPPSINFREPNPLLNLANSPFYVNTSLVPWHDNGSPRRAGVSSFGIGGTNAHVILEDGPPVRSGPTLRMFQLLVISARTEFACNDAARRLRAHIAQDPEIAIADVAYTLQVGRRAFRHRRFVVCAD